ncbi:phage integrase [Ralstonia mannitolilytica]|uniref:phage integrase n=1 Tax=Ralstonia mannitolilytica TaxID=105219 RepID=UPI0028F67C6F|nr:tyrosine-type recombinase/integrase [Ralstonia mannitolilytica]CAJ0733950.1 Tyrosine recombinase XerC [Ralstonia mannitolilytica]
MTVKKTESGWLVDIQPGGRGHKRYRKTFKAKADALAWINWITAKVNSDPDWKPKKKDTRRLSELIDLWFKHHGATLRDGTRRMRCLMQIAERLGDPIAESFTANMFAEYRKERLAANISNNTVNHEHAYLRALFNELSRIGHWSKPNPLANVRQIKLVERELVFLTLDQVKTLLDALKETSSDAHMASKVCLATGARWSEAEGLQSSQVHAGAVHFTATKNGRNRSVPIPAELEAELLDRAQGNDTRLFAPCYGAFRRAVTRAGLELPEGQLTHVLRHTFASHFMMNGGNILALQRILGHSSLTMTMRYAHLAPDHLQEARALNPLSLLDRR